MNTRITAFVLPISSPFSHECIRESPLIETARTVSSFFARYAICQSRSFAGYELDCPFQLLIDPHSMVGRSNRVSEYNTNSIESFILLGFVGMTPGLSAWSVLPVSRVILLDFGLNR
jgi:hypothetical protein